MAKVLYGRAIAARMLAKLKNRANAVSKILGRRPKLAFVVCAPDAAAESYFTQERKACRDLDVAAVELQVPPKRGEAFLVRSLESLSRNNKVDGVLVSLPLPSGFDERRVLAALAPEKDIEGLSPANQGRLYGAKLWADLEKEQVFIPCTALAVLRLIRASGAKVRGANAVVIGRSSVVGRPVAHLLSCLDATVTLCHSKTRDLRRMVWQGDIVVAAIGRPGVIKSGMIRKGAVVVDAGTTRVNGVWVGDVETKGLARRAGWVTPVPGGVGPVTTAELLNALLTAAGRAKPKARTSSRGR